jgi:hypothetical protein
MRKLTVLKVNKFGDAVVRLDKITPPDEVEAKAKWDADRDARQARRRAIIEARERK